MAGDKNKNPVILEELKKELEICQKKRDEYLSGWQRARADFINHKKEELERMGEIVKFATEEMILRALPILDNFYLIEKRLPENLKEDENVKGILQVKNQLLEFLKSHGVEEIKCQGQKFDPNFQEAVEMVEKEDVESGQVIEEVQKGYTLNSKVIRPAKVKVVK